MSSTHERICVTVTLDVPKGFKEADRLVREALAREIDMAYLSSDVSHVKIVRTRQCHHVIEHDVEHGGGNVFSDLFTRPDGRVVGLHPDDIILYPNIEAIQEPDDDPWAYPRLCVWPAQPPFVPTAREFECFWSEGYERPATTVHNGGFFSEANGYDEQAIREIAALEVGAMWVATMSGDHIVKRVR